MTWATTAKATEKQRNCRAAHVCMQCSRCGVPMSTLSCTHWHTRRCLIEVHRPYSRRDSNLVKKDSGTRSMKASTARILDKFSTERAQGVRVGDLWTWNHRKTSSYVAVVAYRQSFPAPCKKAAQLGLYTVATILEQVVLKP